MSGTYVGFGQGAGEGGDFQGPKVTYTQNPKHSSDLAHYFLGGAQIHKIKNK